MELMTMRDLRTFLRNASEKQINLMVGRGVIPAGKQSCHGGKRYWIRSEIEESIKNL